MKRAALATFALLLLLSPLVLHARTTTTFGQNAVGAACNNIEKATDFDAIAQCNAGTGAGTMQTAPLILGTITAPPYANTTCDAGKAGMLQWTGTSFQACGGTSWGSFATGGALDDLTDAKTEYASLYNVFLGSGAGNAVTTGYSDTAVGYNSLYSNTTGYANTAVGREALRTNTEGLHNTAIGREAMYATTTGQSNTAVGSSAVRSNTTGSGNTGIGSYGLYTNTTGSENSALGREALYANTTGGSNTAIGSYALRSNTSGSFSTAVGRDALRIQTTGNNNTAVGYYALYATTTGIRNTAIGNNSLDSNTTGSSNTAVGVDSLTANTSAIENTAVGWGALGSNTTGYYNTALGSYALYSSNTTQHNTGIGRYSLINNKGEANSSLGSSSLGSTTTGSYNTAVGTEAGKANVNGSNNVFVGYQVGYGTLTSGSSNILIGTSSAVTTPAAGTNNWLNIGNTIYGNLSTGSIALGAAAVTGGATIDTSARTDSILFPKGTDAQRPTGVAGMVRYNTTSNCLEAYQGGTPAWACVGGGDSTLGTSTANAKPYRSGEINTGLFSPATGVVSVTTLGTERMRVDANGAVKIGAGAVSAGAILELSAGTGTGYSSVILPKDTTSNRPTTATAGMMRFNTSLNIFEGFNGTDWLPMAPGSGEVGEIKIWPAGTIPSGYLECDGSAVSRTTYATLFAVIGTMYGAGDGTTTFNLPDYRGEFLRGWANGSTNDPDRAARTDRGDGVIGDNVGTKQAGQTLSHLHVVDPPSAASDTVANHQHSVDPPSTASDTVANHQHSIDPPSTVSANANNDHQHSIDPPATDSGTVSANHQHLIEPPATAITSSGAHGHTVPVSVYSSDNVAAGGAVRGVHTNNTSTGAGQGAHTHSVDIAAFYSGYITANHYHTTNIAAFNSGWMTANHGHSVDILSFLSVAAGGHGHTTDISSFLSVAAGGHGHTTDIASFDSTSAGGNETRPRNVSVVYIIRFKEERAASGSVAALTPQTFALSGDTTSSPVSFDGTAPVTMIATVGKIQGRAVASTAPTNGQTLVWNTSSSAWVPGASSLSILGSTTTETSPYRSGETNTGLYSPAAGTVGVVSAGTEIMRITASGVGIGTTPLTKLHVDGGILTSGPSARLSIGDSGGANPATTKTWHLDNTANNLRFFQQPNVSTGGMTYMTLKDSGDLELLKNASIPSENSSLSFGADTRQMLNLYNTSYGIGVQNNTLYLRAAAAFGWHLGGVHSDTDNDPGSGGVNLMHLGSSALTVNTLGDFNSGGIEVQGTQGSLAPFIRFHRPLEDFGHIRYGTDTVNNNMFYMLKNNGANYAPVAGGEFYSHTETGNFRMVAGNYGAFFRNDGTTTNFLLTASGDPYGGWNSLRPFAIANNTGNVSIGHNLSVGGALTTAGTLTVSGSVYGGNGYRTRTGLSGSYGTNWHNMYWNGSAMRLYVDNVDLGSITTSSDYRLKHEVKDVQSGLDRIMKLHPVSYRWKNVSIFKDDGQRHEGFLAHEVQDVIPSAASGKKDELDKEGKPSYQSINPPAIVAVLTKAVQELKAMFDEMKSMVAVWKKEHEELKATVASHAAKIEELEKLNGELKKENQGFSARLKAIEDRLSKKP